MQYVLHDPYLLYIHVGATAAASVQNFRRWLDELAIGAVRCGNPLVRDYDGNRLEGYYHLMKQPEHAAFLNAITGQTAWTIECVQNNLNAGTIVSIEPGGRGVAQMIHMKGGPFT